MQYKIEHSETVHEGFIDVHMGGHTPRPAFELWAESTALAVVEVVVKAAKELVDLRVSEFPVARGTESPVRRRGDHSGRVAEAAGTLR